MRTHYAMVRTAPCSSTDDLPYRAHHLSRIRARLLGVLDAVDECDPSTLAMDVLDTLNRQTDELANTSARVRNPLPGEAVAPVVSRLASRTDHEQETSAAVGKELADMAWAHVSQKGL